MCPSLSLKPLPDSEVREVRALVENLAARVTQLERQIAGAESTAPQRQVSISLEHGKPDLEVGLKLINRIGAVTLAIGIIFFFKYAVDNRWIGATGRVILGLFAGLLLIGFAEWLRKRDQSVFAQGVAGCGLASLFISIYAAFAFYHLASDIAGFVALVIVCALALLLSFLYSSVSIASLGFLGAVLTPLLLRGSGEPSLGLHFPYLLLVAISAVIIALRQRWSVLVPLTTALVMLAALFLINEFHPRAFVAFAFILAVLQFAGYRYAPDVPHLGDSFYLVGHVCLIIALVRIVALFAAHESIPADRASLTSELESFLLGVYGVAILIAGILRKSTADRALAVVLLGLVVAKLYLWDVWQLARFYLITAFVALGVILLAASFIYSRFRTRAEIKPE